MRWVEIAVEVAEASMDAVSNIMIEEGCGGTAVSCFPERVQNAVVGYLPVDDRLESRLENIRERVRRLSEFGVEIGSGEIGLKWVEDEEWATAWKKFFKPIGVGRIVVRPSWEDYTPKDGEVVIDIDPGMAFGTGYHPTTQLCLLALQDYVTGGETVLDVGTGSGILAIAAAKLGASRTVGLDNDPVAVEVARENVKANGLDHAIHIERAESPVAFQDTADIVVANIIAKVIIEMAPDLAAKIKPGGKLIAAGIIEDRSEDVIAALEQVDLKTLEVRRDGEWVALIACSLS